MNFRGTIIAPAYDAVIRNSLIEQVIVGVLAALVLDGGIMAKVVGVAVLGFWICVAALVARRPNSPTKLDLAFVRWGFWPVLAICAVRQVIA